VCRNSDVKCSVVERAHRTIRYMLYKYFTTYRCIDSLPKFVRSYNDTVHSATGMAPSRVTDSDGLALRKKMGARRRSVRVVKVKFRVRQHLRISKETNNFEKAAEQNFSTEIFRIAKMIEGRPRPL